MDNEAEEKLKESILSTIPLSIPQKNREAIAKVCIQMFDIMDNVDLRDIFCSLGIMQTFVKSLLEDNKDTVQ